MTGNNTVAVISNAETTVQEIKSMLVLLRDVDKVECYDYFDAEEYIKKSLPSIIILHSIENNKSCLKLISKIRENPNTKDIPIILYPEFSSTDYIVEAFDLGITDILSTPLKDYELVVRVIWAIKKSETIIINKTKDAFLAKLGIIDENTGFYKKDFSLKYLQSIITEAKNNKQNSCLIMIKTHPTLDVTGDKEALMNALKKSVRLNDTIAAKDDNTYYIFLAKAKLNGAYSVYERILSNISSLTSIVSSVVEIHDELFDDIINVLDYSILRASENGDIKVVDKQDFLDMYKREEIKENTEELEIAKVLEDEPDIEATEEEINSMTVSFEDENEEENKDEEETSEEKEEIDDGLFHIEGFNSENNPISSDKVDLGLKIMQDKFKELEEHKKALKKLKPKTKEEIEEENKEIDERNVILYKQAYTKKLTMVVEPLFKKFASRFQEEYSTLEADMEVAPDISFIRFNKDDIKLNFEMFYDGFKTVKFNLSLSALNTEIEQDSFEIEVMEFDFKKLEIILKTITDEYKNYLTEN